MNYSYINLTNARDLIDGIIIRPLTTNQDATGSLVETLRRDWQDVFNDKELDFAMQYMSITPPQVARDENKWHVHQNQLDRFICISGRIVTACFDPRQNSKTHGQLNLLVMGPQREEEMYLLVIPKEVYHGFMATSETPAYLLNFPTRLYNPDDEGRINKTELDWNKVRQDFPNV